LFLLRALGARKRAALRDLFVLPLGVVPLALPRELALEAVGLFEALPFDGPLLDRRQDCTTRFVSMTTVAKTTGGGERVDLGEAGAPELCVLIREQRELAHARSIQQQSTTRKGE